jgi:hypothetical protein
MGAQFLDIILSSGEEAFLAVGVFVAAVLLIVGIINHKSSEALVHTLKRAKFIQPLLGALLGLIPGCGGAIFVMPLYLKGTVSFGTVIAALVATMGDSAFFLIASNPKQFVFISLISFVFAIITGYTIDYLKIDGGFAKKREKRLAELTINSDDHDRLHHHEAKHIAHENGDEADVLFHHNPEPHRGLIYRFTHGQFYILFWLIMLIGFIIGVLALFGVEFGANISRTIGFGGTVMCLLFISFNRKMIKKNELEQEEHKLHSLKETFIHDAVDVAFVTTWVFVAFIIYKSAVLLVGGENIIASWMITAGIMTVLVGALVGIIPGSGPQIIFIALYGKGLIPFAALLANAISQDGDALFPLLAIDRKSSIIATLITTVPALIIGILWYVIF